MNTQTSVIMSKITFIHTSAIKAKVVGYLLGNGYSISSTPHEGGHILWEVKYDFIANFTRVITLAIWFMMLGEINS